jgi:hypothetical protein
MDAHEVPDWRIYFAAKVGEITGPNKMGAEPGDLVIHLSPTRTPSEGAVMVPVPSPYRLALNIGIRAAHAARAAKKKLAYLPRSGGEKERVFDLKALPALFDYFEEAMIAATFSYQAIETYANARISEDVGDGAVITLRRKGQAKDFDAVSLQREVSTDEKVATVLPRITGLALAKSSKLWQEFVSLGRVRDATVHLKSKDHFLRGGDVDRETLFYQLLNHVPTRYPTTALSVMRHFNKGQENAWLAHARKLLESK